MISVGALQKALNAIIPRLPKGVQKMIPGLLPFLPLAFEITKLLYKHREKIRDVVGNVTKQISSEAKKEANGIAETIPCLPKKMGRKLRRWLTYLPFALEIAKASYGKNSSKVRSLTAPLPSVVRKKIGRRLKWHHRRSRWDFLRRFRR